MINLDLKRLLDHQIEMFALDIERIWKVVRTFVQYCRRYSEALGDIQVPAEEKGPLLKEDDRYTMFVAKRHPTQSFEVAMTTLLRRPRMLKHALRRTWMAWRELHGEVSLQDLLVYSTILTVDARCTAFIRDNWSILVSGKDSNSKNRQDVDAESLWSAAATGENASEKEHLRALVRSLFPGPSTSRRSERGANRERYWQRIVNGWVECPSVRDQEVFLDVLRFRERESEHPWRIVGKMMQDASYTEAFEEILEFRDQGVNLEAREVLTLASALFAEMRQRFGVDANSESCPGFLSLWRLQSRRRMSPDYAGWLWGEMEQALKTSLHLLVDLEYFWASEKYSPLDGESSHRLRTKVADWAREHVDAEYLCRVLPIDPPHVLASFVLGPSREGVERVPDWTIWDWIAPVLVRAAVRDPVRVSPQVAVIFIKSAHRIVDREEVSDTPGSPAVREHETVYTVRKDWIKGLYSDLNLRKAIVDALLRGSVDEKRWSLDTKAFMDQVRRDLQAWRNEGLV